MSELPKYALSMLLLIWHKLNASMIFKGSQVQEILGKEVFKGQA